MSPSINAAHVASMARWFNHDTGDTVNVKPCGFTCGQDGSFHILFNAIRNIKEGEEILYPYGDTRPEVLRSHPWLIPRQKVTKKPFLISHLLP